MPACGGDEPEPVDFGDGSTSDAPGDTGTDAMTDATTGPVVLVNLFTLYKADETAMHPAIQDDFLIDMSFIEFAAIVTAHS